MGINSVMFDLDGTLIDSAADVQSCLVEAFYKALGVTLHFNIRPYLGPTISNIIKAIKPFISEDNVFEIEKVFRSLYNNCGFKKSMPYDGVNDILEFINQAKLKIFVVTNKPIIPSRSIINRYIGWELEIVSPDCYPASGILSKSEMIALLIRRHSLQSKEVLFVGDTAGDIMAAHMNGVRAVGVLYGYGDKDDLYASKPDFIIDDLMQLKPLISSLEG